ncbi:MAG: sigma-E processing peptidase SpoIIGA [Caloramator sp.]|nr:sigma-E processing peptidase SpoIIGA [Caloramator sp.]
MQIIYLDVLLIENVLLNFLLLYTVNRFCRLNRKIYYIISSSVVGAFYVFIVFFPSLNIFYSSIMKICMSILMIIIAFWPRSFRAFLKQFLLFYGVSFFVGGAILSIFYLGNGGNIDSVNGVMMLNRMSSKYLLYGVVVSIFIVKIVFDLVDRHYYLKNKTVDLSIINEDKHIRLTALLDTGNCLKDPITGCPIVIADINYISEVLPKEIIEILNNDKQVTQINDFEINKRLRVIPYTTIGVENGILLGYRVDYIYVFTKDKVGIIKNPIIALSKEHLSKKEDYQAIAYPDIISWEVK